MPAPSNPGWATGYVPSATEWAAEWSSKVDFPAPIDQGGTGGQTSSTANYNILQRTLIGTTPFNLDLMTVYGLQTSLSALSVFLPPLATTQLGDWIDLEDVDYNVNVNNVTITASGTEQIQLFGVGSNSQVLNVAGVRCRIWANNGFWSLLV